MHTVLYSVDWITCIQYYILNYVEAAVFNEIQTNLKSVPNSSVTTDYAVRGSNTGEERFSAPVQTGPGAHPASLTMGTGSFPGVKRPGRGVHHPPLSSAKVKERVELYLYYPSRPSWPVLGWPLPLPFTEFKVLSTLSHAFPDPRNANSATHVTRRRRYKGTPPHTPWKGQ
jgi:hypothetical protein